MSRSISDKRLLFITPAYPPPMVGGSFVYFHTIIENAEHDFDVLCAAGPGNLPEISSPRHRILRSRWLVSSLKSPARSRMLLMYLYLAWRVLLIGVTRRYDLVVLFVSAIGNGFFAAILRLFGVQVVLFALAEEIPLAWRAPGLTGALKRFFLPGYRFADGIVCTCDFVRDRVEEIGVGRDRMCVIPNPISSRRKRESNGAGRTADGRRMILSVGRAVPRKGFHLLVDALDLVRKDVAGVHLTVIGEGEALPSLVEQIARLGLEDFVTLAGTVEDEARLSRYYSECDLFVLANLFLDDGNCEGIPTVVVEASAHGKPVIAGANGGALMAVREGVSGYLVDPTDTARMAELIKKILLDKALAARLGEGGIRKVQEDHDPVGAGKRFSAFIRQVQREVP